MISEPTTTLTDYLLAALAAWLGWKLFRDRRREGFRGRQDWALAFWAMAVGAGLGGTSHGFGPLLSEGARAALWKATVFSIGLVSYFVISGTARAVWTGGALRAVRATALVKLGVYWWWMASHDEFRYVIYDYGPSLLLALLLGLWLWKTRGDNGGVWIAAGVAVSFAGASVQLSGFALHCHFNHNDLYHVIQMAGLWLLYRGARELAGLRSCRLDPRPDL